MKNVGNIDFKDFYFNGHCLSDFGGTVGGKQPGVSPLSLLPNKEIQTEAILGRHGSLYYGMKYNPRTFTIPVVFDDITNIRGIAGWLGTETLQDFYWKNDTVKLQVIIDGDPEIEASLIFNGVVEIKFLAPYPFFKLIEDEYYSVDDFTKAYIFFNEGNRESFPLIKIGGVTAITFKINGEEISITNINEYVYIDMLYCTVYKGEENMYDYYTGNFVTLPPGNNELSITNVTSVSGTWTGVTVEIWCRSEFI
jgi:phage-related protein